MGATQASAPVQADWSKVAQASSGQWMAASQAAGYGSTNKTGGMGDTTTSPLNKKTLLGQ